ncbi:Autoinducer 2 import ATP-binding protein LsrA [Cedecea neteri]|uniref:Autoinducer 2 import ATP-binding protein LsrA n=1 Tax=Cedecea neteri TaxID=158822 RepID=A0A2X3IYD3_9ENTR|nr:Autoinducer 2 import ATP-binding protein LsrA [Cedecea neteri]
MNELKADGICVVFVSHRLDEVMEVADRISVMRDGKLVGTWQASELDSNELAFLMTGQRFHYSPLPEKPPVEKQPMLELRRPQPQGQISQYQSVATQRRDCFHRGPARIGPYRTVHEPVRHDAAAER